MKTNFKDLLWEKTAIKHTNQKFSKKCIIGVPVYKEMPSNSELNSLNQLCKVINKSYEICLICPFDLDISIYNIIAQKYNIEFSTLYCTKDYFKSTETYSYLCETSQFYRCFLEYDYLFIYQLDAWIFSNLLNYYINLGVDYIGSPWKFDSFGFNTDTVGNGGVSLRNVLKFIDICEKLTDEDFQKPYVDKEDLFFCKTLRNKIDLKTPTVKLASNFSLSSEWDYFIKKYNNGHLPMCVHAWEQDVNRWGKYIKIETFEKPSVKTDKLQIINKEIIVKKDVQKKTKVSTSLITKPKQVIVKSQTRKTDQYSYSDFIQKYYGITTKQKQSVNKKLKSGKINILIIHYNTPYLTECLIKSINKFVGHNCIIYIFDNSDKEPFTFRQENIKVFDNTKGQIIDFEKELEKYPNKGKEASNTYASFKHCVSVNKCFSLINDNFILLDSDVLLKNDISKIYNDDYIFSGEIETNICNIKRLAPFCCFINVKKCKEYNINYFYENLMHGINYKIEGHKYDTGAAFFKYASQYQYNIIKLNDYIVHYKGASWDPNYINNRNVHFNLNVYDWLDKYKDYWCNNKVIYTCITNDYENILDPSYVQNDFDYVCFTDNANYKGSVWHIRKIPEELKNLSKIKQQRNIKICPHKYLSEYEESIWVDGSIDILGDMNSFINDYYKEKKTVYIRKHPVRSCIYKEAEMCIKIKKDISENIIPQIQKYKDEGYPKDNGLAETNIIYRIHNDEYCKTLMELWANEVIKYSHRDQLSFNYVLWKIGNTGFQYLPSHLTNSKYFFWYSSHDRKIKED